jgi:hypothetical protein
MNFAIDNTVTNPSALVGVVVGSTYLVPPSGASGAWLDKEDQIAVWGGSVWNFLRPATGTEYQIQTGPNAGNIYVRTNSASPSLNLVENGDLIFDIEEGSQWFLATTGSGAAEWSPGIITLSNPASAPHSAEASVVITTEPGTNYELSYGLTSLVADNSNQFARLTVKELPSGNIITDPSLAIADNLTFQAVTAQTSIAFRVTNAAGTAVSSAVIDFLRVKRKAELMSNGDFENGDFGWDYAEGPWVIDAGQATAIIDYSGHEPFPALRRIVNNLTVNRYYRIQFDATGNFNRGILSVWAGGVLLGDVNTSGTHVFFFKAQASSAAIEFPLTHISNSTFEVVLDNVSVMAALWQSGPILRALLPGLGGLTSGGAMGRPVRINLAGTFGFAAGAKRDRSGYSLMPGMGGLSAGSTKSTSRYVGPILMPGRGGLTAGASRNKFGAVTMAGQGGLEVTMQSNGYVLVRDVVQRILNLWGHPSCGEVSCDSPATEEAIGKLNAAMQRLYATGKDFGFVSTVPMTITKSGVQQFIPLPGDVVAVKRVVFQAATNQAESTFADFPLRPVQTRHEYESFAASHSKDIWPLDTSSADLMPYVIPLAFFIEAEDTRAVIGIPRLRLMLGPVPNLPRTWKIDLQATIRPPNYRCRDVPAGTILAVPHNYAETLLIPLALYYATASRYFTKRELLESVTAQAQEAREFVGEIQPAPAEASKGGDR